MLSDAICCYMLLYVAICCYLLLYVAVYCYMLLSVAICCYMLLYVAICCYLLLYYLLLSVAILYVAICCYMLLCVATSPRDTVSAETVLKLSTTQTPRGTGVSPRVWRCGNLGISMMKSDETMSFPRDFHSPNGLKGIYIYIYAFVARAV